MASSDQGAALTFTRNGQRRLFASLALALMLLTLGHFCTQTPANVAEARSLLERSAKVLSNFTLELLNGISHAVEKPSKMINQISDSTIKCFKDVTGICAPDDPDAKRNVSEIIRSREFKAEEYDVVTGDGYILTIQRIVNPLVAEADRSKLKPVILQHGLMSSSVDWVINSVAVRPSKWPRAPPQDANNDNNSILASFKDSAETESDGDSQNKPEQTDDNSIEDHQQQDDDGGASPPTQKQSSDSQEHPNSLGFYLANEGYDVFLANSRGNKYGQRHTRLSSWNPKFWDFTFDEQIKYDLPDTLAFVQKLTGHTKVGYVGHSQGTTMMLGLLADRPEMEEMFEPVILLAPVAFVSNSLSPVKYFSVYTPIFQNVDMWFGSSNAAVRYLAPLVCTPEVVRKDICANIVFLSVGFDEAQFDLDRVTAYLAHMPSGTSVKNIAHWGQMVNSARFAHFDHGILANQMVYKSSRPPSYDLAKVRSKSITLFTADNDWLASPKDVALLKANLEVPFKAYNISEEMPKWNHIDFLYGKDCGRLVNTKVLETFQSFDK